MIPTAVRHELEPIFPSHYDILTTEHISQCMSVVVKARATVRKEANRTEADHTPVPILGAVVQQHGGTVPAAKHPLLQRLVPHSWVNVESNPNMKPNKANAALLSTIGVTFTSLAVNFPERHVLKRKLRAAKSAHNKVVRISVVEPFP